VSRRGSLFDLRETYSSAHGLYRDPYIRGLLYEGQIACCFGRQEIGKSYLWGQLGVAMAAGKDWGRGRLEIPEPREVTYLLSEGHEWDLGERLVPMYELYPEANDHFEYIIPDYIDFLDRNDAGVKELTTMVLDLKTEVLIIDSLYSCLSGSVDSARDMGRFKMSLNLLMSKNPRLAVVLLHHEHRTRRDQQGDLLDERENAIAGSWVIQAMCDEMYQLTAPTQDKDGNRHFIPTKHRSRLAKIEPFYIEIDEETGLLNTLAQTISAKAKELRDYMKMIGGMTTDDLKKWYEKEKVNRASAYRYASALVDSGEVKKVRGGWEWTG
jgi:RecA-family ATPase